MLSQIKPIVIDTIPEANNPYAQSQQEKIIHLLPPIMVKGKKDFVSLRAELIDLVDPENYTFKSNINNLKI